MDPWLERRSGWKQRSDDGRSVGEIEYGRIVHSASFRRLQGKTQILNLGDSDFYRTRLTHSIEVAQIAVSVTAHLRKNTRGGEIEPYLPEAAMIQAIGSTHDLGHPPFGHGGEVALNYCMRKFGGFEGNGQTLRILSTLEKHSEFCGADLTRRALIGTLKYPVVYELAKNPALEPDLAKDTTVVKLLDRDKSKPPKCFMKSEQRVVDWLLSPLSSSDRDMFVAFERSHKDDKHNTPLHKSFDCSIMDIADDIAFGVHDLEDVVALGLLTQDQVRREFNDEIACDFISGYSDYQSKRFDFISDLFMGGRKRKQVINRLVGYFIRNCFVAVCEGFSHPFLRFRLQMRPSAKIFLEALKAAVRKYVIFSASVQHLEFKGQQMVLAVFEACQTSPDKILPEEVRRSYDQDGMRAICDYVTGMTDTYLLRTYERLYSPRMGSIFDKL